MPRIRIDPSTAKCPDYTLDVYEKTRALLLNDTVNAAQAATILCSIWEAANQVEKQQWRDQVLADEEEAEQVSQEAEDPRKLKEEELEKEKVEEQQIGEMEKYKAKHAPIPKRPVPRQQPVIASQYATRRLQKGGYVPLWYWTNKGLEHARNTFNSTEEDAMSFLQEADGSISLVPAYSSKDAKTALDDQELDWEQFSISASRMLNAMTHAGWPQEWVTMMASFWKNIKEHPFRGSDNPLDPKTLLVYQAEQRKLWHYTINTPNAGYNLSEINEEVLLDTKQRLFWREMSEKEREREQRVSAILQY